MSDFDGKKRLILSTSSWIGGKNDFLGIAYLVVGSLSIVFALIFFIKHKLSPRYASRAARRPWRALTQWLSVRRRKFGDLSLIEWMDASYQHSNVPHS